MRCIRDIMKTPGGMSVYLHACDAVSSEHSPVCSFLLLLLSDVQTCCHWSWCQLLRPSTIVLNRTTNLQSVHPLRVHILFCIMIKNFHTNLGNWLLVTCYTFCTGRSADLYLSHGVFIANYEARALHSGWIGFAVTWGYLNDLHLLPPHHASWVVHWAAAFSAPVYTDICTMMLTYCWLSAHMRFKLAMRSLFYISKW